MWNRDNARSNLTVPEEKTGAERSFPTVGRWRVTALPGGWMYVANYGIKQMVRDVAATAANVSIGEDVLGASDGLQGYIAAQSKLMQHHLSEAKMAGPQPMPFQGAEEAYLFFVRHRPNQPEREPSTMLHVQQYVRSGLWVGIVTLTVPEVQLQAVRTDYELFVKGLRIMPAAPVSEGLRPV